MICDNCIHKDVCENYRVANPEVMVHCKHYKGLFETEREWYRLGADDAIFLFAERLKELYTDKSITNDMHCSIGVIKQNIDDIKKQLTEGAK